MSLLQSYNNVATEGQAKQRVDAGDIPFIPAPTDSQVLQFLAKPVIWLAAFFALLFGDMVLYHKWIPIVAGFLTTVLIGVGLVYLLFKANRLGKFIMFLIAQCMVIVLIVAEVLTAGLLSFLLIPLVVLMQLTALMLFYMFVTGDRAKGKASEMV